nr:MAG TPA: hypothetical protein [Caudoviricetes sp.]
MIYPDTIRNEQFKRHVQGNKKTSCTVSLFLLHVIYLWLRDSLQELS